MLMTIGIGIMRFSLVLDLFFNQRIVDLELDSELNKILVLKELVFDNEWFSFLILGERTIVITIKYICKGQGQDSPFALIL